MGRSKFPGKPSKSINRKRISVLQLKEKEEENSSAVQQQQQHQQLQQHTNVHDKNNCDQDQGRCGGGGGGRAGAGGSHSNVNGCKSISTTITTPTIAAPAAAAIDPAAVENAGNSTGNGSAASAVANIAENKKEADSDAKESGDDDEGEGEDDDEDDDDDGDDDDDDDDDNYKKEDNDEDDDNNDNDDNGVRDKPSENEKKHGSNKNNINRKKGDNSAKNDNATANFSSTSSSSSSSTTTSSSSSSSSLLSYITSTTTATTSATSIKLHSNKKFKNLNVGKEVMLPSSSKEKLQYNCNIAAGTSAPSSSNDAAVVVTTPSASSSCATTPVTADDSSSNFAATSTTSFNPFTTSAAATLEAKVDVSDIAAVVNNCDSEKSVKEQDISKHRVTDSLSYIKNINDTASMAALSPSSSTTDSTSATTATKHKKTVTFKNILETSDDKSAVKKFYNPDNRTPLVSIMKKECMNRPLMYSRSECIVRPSRLTEILKNNSNIDKLNCLKFRSVPSSSSISTTAASSIFGTNLLRAFGGVPEDEDDDEHDAITFRVNSTVTQIKDDIETQNGDDNDEDEDDYDNEKASDNEEEQQLVVDKHFVLPKRSTRSSRVIKPNKRFLDDAITICRKPTANRKQNILVGTNHMKKELHCNIFSLGGHHNTVDGVNDEAVKSNLGIKTMKEINDSKSSFTLTPSPFSNTFGATTICGSSTNKFVLRKPRLQFDSSLSDRHLSNSVPIVSAGCALSKPLSHSSICSTTPRMGGNTSAFTLVAGSTNMASNANLANICYCCVCSTQIQPKNIQQARKYGELACETCRKFISKITKKSVAAASASPMHKTLQLQCKSDGNCTIQSKSSVRNFKKVYKERCSACWLKKCIQVFHFPSGHKLRLSAILPASIFKQVEKHYDLDTEKNEISIKKDIAANEFRANSNLFGATTRQHNQSNHQQQNQKIKWKTSVESSTESVKLKSNTITEGNVTFGGTPLIRPAILEKSMFLKNMKEQQKEEEHPQQQQLQVQQTQQKPEEIESKQLVEKDVTNFLQKSSHEKPIEKLKISKRREKLDREKEKDKQQKDNNKDAAAISTKNITINKSTDIEAVATAASTSMKTVTPKENLPSNNSVTNTLTTAPTLATTTVSSSTAAQTNTAAASLTVTPPSVVVSPNDIPKRQRIDLKGPRVKHVCRSASIVLGQPMATFGDDEVLQQLEQDEDITVTADTAEEDKLKIENVTNAEDISKDEEVAKNVINENDNCSSCKEELSEQDGENTNPSEVIKTNTKEITEPPVKTTKIELRMATSEITKDSSEKFVQKVLQPLKSAARQTSLVNSSNTNSALTVSKKYMRQINEPAPSSQLQQQRRKEPTQKAKLMISTDFWENYDPAEVCQTGFGLIVTETVAQRALCFLCGSTGLDPLIFCACCCEPYHQYCVLDEFNLKHSSLDDTMASLLDTSVVATSTTANNVGNFSLMTNRLNWICPRCTICYTCNMSSGSKVKCQKCQKNYHSTCLGTSKRLLGADRPLICVSCLKCKSCATTKVSKFVGNLPMCTTCFKLRKKGNYCPICQKCYDDNDFDLKMMECGDCKQWVHSKCEGLSDEQYNLLSTLPETTEFICKKCARRDAGSRLRAEEWRQAVKEEFKTTLLSVLKLLSKSRQACALLKLSPRKKMRCTCQHQQAGTRRIQPKSLRFFDERDTLGSDGESQCSEDIYEFKEKSHTSVSSEQPTKPSVCSCNSTQVSSYYSNVPVNKNSQNALSLVDIKKKICNGEYVSLAEFNYDMNNIIQNVNCDELIIAYTEILSEQFPWFQNETKACTDALEEDMFESCSYVLNNSLETHETYHIEEQERSVIDLPDDIDEVIYSLKSRTDQRICLFCRKTGEGVSNEESRLIYCGQDCWVHTNCAMWSAEVFEEIDGSLQNVHSAVSRGRMIKCTVCGNRGATVGCNVKSCGEHYHYACARSNSCAFLTDKTVYCPTHAKDAVKSSAVLETNFEVSRPVYVELDRKRKKLIEPTRVQFHIGSLEVKQLGTVFPKFSDTFEAIVPINFLCSRLYWSFKEPWKIVEYTVRTTIQNNYASTYTTHDTGKHFTVDHANSNASIMGLAQIARWHQSLARCEQQVMDFEQNDYINVRSTALTKLIPEYLAHNQNSSASVTDENTEEEPQTNADLLPPEIKDAIFEDLPHEILDGISMLDIFPKFMIYEELGNIDGKSGNESTLFINEQSKDESPVSNTALTNISDDDTVNSAFSKQLESSNSWSSSTAAHIAAAAAAGIEDAMLSATRQATQQRNKTELLKKTTQTRAWAKCIDGNAIKRRKISKGLQDIRFTEGVLLSLNQSRAKKESVRRQSQCLEANSVKTFTWSAAKRYPVESSGSCNKTKDEAKIKLMQVDGVDDSITEYRIITTNGQPLSGTVKCERCHCTYRNFDSFQRHLPTCEPFSTSESESETAPKSPEIVVGTPIMTTAEIDLNKLGQRSNMANPYIQTAFQPQAINIGNINGIPIATTNMQGLQGFQNLPGLQNIQIQQIQPQPSMGGNFFISQAPATSSADELQFFSNPLQGLTTNLGGTYTLTPTTACNMQSQQQPQLIAVSTNPDGTHQFIQLPAAPSAANQPAQQQQHVLQQANAYQTLQTAANGSDKKFMLPIVGGKTQKTAATKSAQQLNATAVKAKIKASNTVKPIQSKVNPCATVTHAQSLLNQQPITVFSTAPNQHTTAQLLQQNLLQQMQQQQQQQQQPQLLFQTNNTAGGHQQQTPIIMQQLGAAPNNNATNLISFVATDPTQHPAQVQYVSIPTATAANDFKTQAQAASPFITNNANSLLQSAFLQTDGSGNLVLTTAPQLLTQAQPQVIGTIIQPQTLQLGGNVIAATTGADPNQQQQLIIGNAGTTGLEMINAGAPQVILAASTQPMYYGLETIVQNTVMSSQQFVSTAMPGVLSQNASFSATTTQVFQASKIEPIVDLPTSYVVLNNVDAGPSLQVQQASATTGQQSNFALQPQQQQAQNIEIQQGNQQQLETSYRIQTPVSSAATTATLYQQPQQQQSQNVQFIETAVTNQQNQQQQQQQQQQPTVQIVTAKIPPVTQTKRSNQLKATNTTIQSVTKVQPQVVNKVMPTTVPQKQQLQQQNKIQQQRFTKSLTHESQQSTDIKTSSAISTDLMQQVFNVATNSNNTQSLGAATTAIMITPAIATEIASSKAMQSGIARKTNMIRPINKAEIKPKVMKAMVVTNKQQQLQQQQQQQQQPTNKLSMLKPQQQCQSDLDDCSTINIDYEPMLHQQHDQQEQQQQQQQQLHQQIQQNTDIQQQYVVQLDDTNCSNNTNNYNNYIQQQQQHVIDYDTPSTATVDSNDFYQLQQDIVNILPTTSCSSNRLQYTTSTLNTYNPNVPTNIVNPIPQQQQHCQYSNNNNSTTNTQPSLISRPTNRVLPMQQKQENNILTSANVKTPISKVTNHNDEKYFENNTQSNKIAYETDIIKENEQQHLLQIDCAADEQQQALQLLEQVEASAPYEKESHSPYLDQQHTPKCISNELQQTIEPTTNSQQMQQIVADDLQHLNAGNLGDDHHHQHLEATPEMALSDITSSVNNEEDEDDDDFSLKMPTDDADQELSDSDEPAVKEKISKILDNLTNEDCGPGVDSTASSNTYMDIPIESGQTHHLQAGFKSEPIATANYNVVVANTQPNTLEFTTDKLNSLPAVTTDFVLEKINAEKICTPITLENSTDTTQTIVDTSAQITSSTSNENENEASVAEMSSYKTAAATPHPHPERDLKKISGPHLLYEIQSEDGFTYKSSSISEIWEKVFEAVQVARRAHGLAPLPEGPLADMSGVQMIGLKTNALKYLIEQLPGVEKCTKYTPKYHKPTTSSTATATSSGSTGVSSLSQLAAIVNVDCNSTLDYSSEQDELLHENPYEAVRCEPYSKRSEYDMFSWLASRHRKQPIQVFVPPSDTELIPRRGTGSNLPMAMKYRTLKETYKDYVGVFRSHIHGRGLYCTKDIEAGEMVIEYAGELIRSTLTDKRERNYDSRGIGCYMFKIDDNLVVDATMRGNAARFINHSCEPNCYSKVVDILGHKHIIIFALRRIVQGEELTYDYKFPFEDEKIPCSCGSKKCRKYLN